MTGKPAASLPPSASALRAAFDGQQPYMVGLEDEVMVLDPETFELAPRASQVLSKLKHDSTFKLELPASQLEIVTAPCAHVAGAADALLDGRRRLSAVCGGEVRFGAAAVHPTSGGTGELNRLASYEHTIREYGPIARRQLVCAFQVHVSIGHAERALAVYNAARSYLPMLAAIAANGPFYEGRDTGLASVRPVLGELLPRHGVPPPIPSWEAYAEILRWGGAAGTFPDARAWWWDLRPHRHFGTLEFRVPDGQSTVADAAAITAIAQALTAWLGERHDAGESLAVADSWRIAENSWSACRYGVEGAMVDLHTGEPAPTRERLAQLLRSLAPVADRLGTAALLRQARRLVDRNGAIDQRSVAAEGGVGAIAPWLAQRFLDPWDG